MNCIECKYKNSKYENLKEGDCPPPEGEEEKEEEEEEERVGPDGECPRNNPILIKNNICVATK